MGKSISKSQKNKLFSDDSGPQREVTPKQQTTLIGQMTFVRDTMRRFKYGFFGYIGPGSESIWNFTSKPHGTWNDTAALMINEIKDAGHPILGIRQILRGCTLTHHLRKGVRVHATH